MRPTKYVAESLTKLLSERKIATMPELKAALGTNARRTVFRKLAELSYRTSYSHRGRYYTLDRVAKFDELGLWSCEDVRFSAHGTLLSTACALVEASERGHFADELDKLLHVCTKDALRKLVADGRLTRVRLAGQFLYCTTDAKRAHQQLLARRLLLAEPGVVAAPVPDSSIIPEELRAAIVLFFSMLDEKMRRLFAGLEALKTGRGGDSRIAELLGLDAATVSRGRRELLSRDVDPDRVRKAGGGRKPTGKKLRKS